jgi:hypothetical protein
VRIWPLRITVPDVNGVMVSPLKIMGITSGIIDPSAIGTGVIVVGAGVMTEVSPLTIIVPSLPTDMDCPFGSIVCTPGIIVCPLIINDPPAIGVITDPPRVTGLGLLPVTGLIIAV